MNPFSFTDNPSGLQSPIDHVSRFDLSVDQFPSSLFLCWSVFHPCISNTQS